MQCLFSFRLLLPNIICSGFVVCNTTSLFFVKLVDVGRSLKPFESHFDSDGSESRKLYKFDFLTISIATENFCEANKIWQDQNETMYKVFTYIQPNDFFFSVY